MQVGIVDTGRVLNESKAGKFVSNKLQELNRSWQEKASLLEQQLIEAKKRLSKDDAKTPLPKLFKHRHEVRMLEMELNHLQQSAQTDLEAHSEFWQTSLSQTLSSELENYGKKLQLSMVLTGPSAQIPFVATTIDITEKIIVEFDKVFKPTA